MRASECVSECRRTGLYTASECREMCRGRPTARERHPECGHSDEECPFLEEHG